MGSRSAGESEWRNLKFGSSGKYLTVGASLGLGVTRDYGHAASLAEFVGYGETAGVGLSYGPIGGSYSATQNIEGDWVAQEGALGWSPSQPYAAVRNVGFAATATAGKTFISECTVRGQ